MYSKSPGTEVSIVGGSQVPEIPLRDVSGSAGGMEFRQSGPIGSNRGTMSVTTSITMVYGSTHGIVSTGVKV